MMKKSINVTFGIVILFAIIYFLGLRTPLVVKGIKKQVKAGQSLEQVLAVLNGAGKKPDLCCWQVQGTSDALCSDPKTCDFPDDQILFNGREQAVRLRVLFMGPGFLHNDFHIVFDGHGVVAAISELKHWD